MSVEDKPILLILFVNAESQSYEQTVRDAIASRLDECSLVVFDVTFVPEIAELFGVVLTPTLIREDFFSNHSSRLAGRATPELVKEFCFDRAAPRSIAAEFKHHNVRRFAM